MGLKNDEDPYDPFDFDYYFDHFVARFVVKHSSFDFYFSSFSLAFSLL